MCLWCILYTLVSEARTTTTVTTTINHHQLRVLCTNTCTQALSHTCTHSPARSLCRSLARSVLWHLLCGAGRLPAAWLCECESTTKRPKRPCVANTFSVRIERTQTVDGCRSGPTDRTPCRSGRRLRLSVNVYSGVYTVRMCHVHIAGMMAGVCTGFHTAAPYVPMHDAMRVCCVQSTRLWRAGLASSVCSVPFGSFRVGR